MTKNTICLSLFMALFIFYACGQSSVKLEWAKSFGNTGWDIGYNITTDPTGDIITVGEFEGIVDFDPGPGNLNLDASGFRERKLFIQKLDPSANLIWAKELDLGSFPPYDTLPDILLETDVFGNIYLSGHFRGTVDLDPGPDTFNIISRPPPFFNDDAFVLKLDINGNFLWGFDLGSEDRIEITSMEPDPNGNVYLVGEFQGTVDFDPGPSTFNMTDSTYGDIFIQKIDPLGNFLWAKRITSPLRLTMKSMGVDGQGDVVLSGLFQGNGTADFDPGPNFITLSTPSNYTDIFFLKLDSSGNFVWLKQVGGIGGERVNSLDIGSSGDIYSTGTFWRTVDFDPGPGTHFLQHLNIQGGEDVFILKLNSQGDFRWVKHIGGSLTANYAHFSPQKIKIDELENTYISGWFTGDLDLDPGPGIAGVYALNEYHSCIVKFDQAGEYVWSEQLEVDQRGLIANITTGNGHSLYFTGGFYNSIDFDPNSANYTLSPQSSKADIYIAKWSQDTCSGLRTIIDSTLDVNCLMPGFVSGHATRGEKPYTYSWNINQAPADSFLTMTSSGIYELIATDASGCSRSAGAMIFGPTYLSRPDVRVNISTEEFRPGRNSWIWIEGTNTGCVPVTGNILLTLDPFLSLVSANPPPDSISGNHLFWNVSNMNVDSDNFRAQVEVNVSTQAMMGDQICNRGVLNQKRTNNNTKFSDRGFCREVINSYDPNDKRVYPEGACEEGFITNEEVLTYTLRFQNTGNASAIDIYLLDSLDANLDLNTVRVIGQSHNPMITEVLDGQVLKFRFDDIYLPDSITDEPNSHGYVMYEVSPHPNLPIGTEIKNTVAIYFDFNEPVITNTVLNTIIDVVPAQDTGFVRASACNGYELNGRLYTSSGDYFQLISRDGSCDSVVSLSLTLQPLDTSITLIGRTLTAREGGAHGLNVSYQWVDCANGNAPISGATSQSFTPQSDGNYAVIMSRDNCSEMSACINVSTVGIDPDFQSEIRYYPNPSTGVLHIDFGRVYSYAEMEIINALGQTVQQHRDTFLDKISIDLPSQGGLYFIKLDAGGKRAVLKVWRK